MRIDIYRRTEYADHFSYLAVPEGKLIPAEVVNTDWESIERSVDIEDHATRLTDLAIDDPLGQIKAKGYAITSANNLVHESPQS